MEMLRGGLRSQLRQRALFNSPTVRRQPNPQLLRRHIQSTFRTRPEALPYARHLHTDSKRPTSALRKPCLSRPTRRWDSSDAELSTKADSELSFSQRIKKLSREYGWAAIYIYFTLSALDFPFCFLAVKWLGTDLIGHWEHVIVSNVKHLLQWPLGGTAHEQVGNVIEKAEGVVHSEDGKRLLEANTEAEEVIDHGYKEAVKANSGKDASIWTQLALAYAIHKSFIFLRVPFTAAVTPKIVKTLRGWGWNIGRPTRKVKSPAIKGASKESGTRVNKKGSGVKDD